MKRSPAEAAITVLAVPGLIYLILYFLDRWAAFGAA
jgi:hypothetical protein